MRQNRPSKLRLLRPSDAALPLAFLIAAIAGHGETAAAICAAKLAAHTLGLSTAEGARIAFATQPSMRAARGTVKLALLLQCAGAILCGVGAWFFRGELALVKLLGLTAAGLLLNIEHTFYEYLFAAGEKGSAMLCRLLTSILLLAGMLMSPALSLTSEAPKDILFPLCASGVGMLVSAVIGLAIGGGLKGRLNPQVLRVAPRASLQSLLYPALAVAAMLLVTWVRLEPIAFFAGLTLYQLCRTPFRRSSMEGRTFNRAVFAIALMCAAAFGATRIPALGTLPAADLAAQCALMLLLAAACVMILFSPGHRRG